jgi:acyl carrier protein
MSEVEIYCRLAELFREIFEDESLVIGPETTADDIEGWDSLKMIKIVIAVMEQFKITIRTREIEGLTSVGDLVAIIQNKTNS